MQIKWYLFTEMIDEDKSFVNGWDDGEVFISFDVDSHDVL